MSKMANGGNVGGDNPNSDVNLFTQQKMTPQQWADYGKKQGWELFETKLTSPIEEQIKRGKYLEYINPKEYTRMPDGRLVKISDVGKTIVDYKGDPTYKPIIAYGYKDTDIKDKTIESKPKGSAVILKNTPDRYFSEKNPNYTTFVKKGGTSGQMDKNIYVDNKTGKEINIDKSFLEGGKYNPVFIEQNAPVQSKKKGGMIKKYKDGTTPEGVNSFSFKNISPDVYGMAGNAIGTGIDAYDREDGESSVAGQALSGALKGAGAGASFGLPGALIGGGIGLITGISKGQQEKEERKNIAKQKAYAKVKEIQESTNPRKGSIRTESYNEQDTKTGLAGIFAKGGTIKGAGTGTSDSIVTDINKKGIPEGSFITPAKNNEMAKGIRGMVLGQNPNKVAEFKKGGTPKSDKVAVSNGEHLFTPAEKEKIIKYLGKEILEKLAPEAEENEMEKNKGGEMIKRADGSYSKRGLWDNIRANKGSGKKPTPEMLKQEKKIIEEKAKGGYVVKRSSERKGKTHVVIGPDGTKKYFGDAKLGQHPNNPARKKAFYARHEKNLKKNPYFRAFARETWAEGGTVGSKMNKEMLESELMSKKAKGGNLTKSKAKEILHDKSVHGKPLTDKQRKYMGWVAGGKKNMGGIVGKYAMGGNVNKNFDWV